MSITDRVHEIIFEELKNHPEGVRWVDLAKAVLEREPNFHPKTVNGLIWKLPERFQGKITKPQPGLFKFKD